MDGEAVRKMVGTFILSVAGILASIFAIALRWPWSWWAWVLIGAPCITGGILMIYRGRKSHELQSTASAREVATASGDRSVALNTNYGIVSTGDNTNIER